MPDGGRGRRTFIVRDNNYCARQQRPATRVCLFQGGAGAAIGGQAGHARRGAADRGEYRQVAARLLGRND
jgi:hypothetical protein